jgi:hypothetical protein
MLVIGNIFLAQQFHAGFKLEIFDSLRSHYSRSYQYPMGVKATVKEGYIS